MATRTPSTARRAGDLQLVALFALALALPVGGRFLDRGADGSTLPERRAPEPAPRRPRELGELGRYPAAFEAWLGDRFGFRGTLIRWHNVVKVFGFGVSPSDELVVGQGGWIFTASERALEAHRGLAPLSADVLAHWKQALEQRRDWLRERGAEYLVVVCPGKPAIYPEQLPAGMRRGAATPLDQLLDFMARSSDVELLDLRAPLLAARAGDRPGDWLYYPFGTHWTERGNLVACREIVRRLQRWFPALAPWAESDFRRELSDEPGDHWGGRLRLEDRLPQRSVVLRPLRPRRARPAPEREPSALGVLELPDPELPRGLVVHDSYGLGLWPFLGEHFARLASSGELDLDRAAVLAEAPDVVIHVLVERQLLAMRPTLWDLDGSDARAAFEASREVLLSLADPDVLQGVQPWHRARLTPPEPGREALLALRVRGPGRGLSLPPFAVPAGRTPILRLDLEASVESRLTVLYQVRGQPEYRLSRSVEAQLAPGRDTLHLALPASDLEGRLLLLFEARGTYELRALEVRACAPGG